MMVYVTVDELKRYIGNHDSADDELLSELLNEAIDFFEEETGRVFEASSDTTRKFDVDRDTEGRTLYFDEDLASITTVTTNADDGSGGTDLTASEYVTLPRNRTPYYGIRILGSSDNYWDYTDDPEAGIEITGRWAWSTTAPDDVQRAIKRLVKHLYNSRDQSGDVDRPLLTGDGVMILPTSIPNDVERVIKRYRKQF